MIGMNPLSPVKGRGAVRCFIDCRDPYNRERVLLVKLVRPNHHFYNNCDKRHYLSPEAYEAAIADLINLRDQKRFYNAMVGKSTPLLQSLNQVKIQITKYDR
jgi:hypothetical protein